MLLSCINVFQMLISQYSIVIKHSYLVNMCLGEWFSEIPYVLNPRYMAWDGDWFQNIAHLYSPALKKGGYTGFGLSAITSILHSVRHNVSAQYLENNLIEFHQSLYRQDLGWDYYTSFFTRL